MHVQSSNNIIDPALVDNPDFTNVTMNTAIVNANHSPVPQNGSQLNFSELVTSKLGEHEQKNETPLIKKAEDQQPSQIKTIDAENSHSSTKSKDKKEMHLVEHDDEEAKRESPEPNLTN